MLMTFIIDRWRPESNYHAHTSADSNSVSPAEETGAPRHGTLQLWAYSSSVSRALVRWVGHWSQ